MKQRLKNDIILIFAIVLISAIIWGVILITRDLGAKIEIRIDDELYGTYSLSSDNTIEVTDGISSNTVIIEDGTARVVCATCPDKYCVDQGSIKYDGEMIICLPNKVIVEVVDGNKSDVDIVAG